LASVLAQDAVDCIDRIVVLGPDRYGLVPADPRILHVPDVPPGPAGPAYNRGLALATGEFVVLMDADVVLSSDWLSIVLERHGAGWDVVAGGVCVPAGSYLAQVYNFSCFHGELATHPPGPRSYLTTMNLSVRRSVAEAVGPVREDIPRWYDLDWTLRMRRAGYRLLFEPAARVWHFPCYVTPTILCRTWFASGSVAQALRPTYPDLLPNSRWLDHPWLLLLLSPGLATAVAARVGRAAAGDHRVWATLPWVWLTKMAWCLGASHGRLRGAMPASRYTYVEPPKAPIGG
jgi:glycosyltransferase involved in cell wall biosynthesis